jgi:hypothetical protein
MTPTLCRVKHDPPNTYGDCIRACIAAMLDITNADDVPHFLADGPDTATAFKRIADYLSTRGYVPFYSGFDASLHVDELKMHMKDNNPDVHYILFGETTAGINHAVVCRGAEVVNDPAWFQQSIVKPGASNWLIMVIARA